AQLVDVNGDGLVDFVRAYRNVSGNDKLKTALNTGQGWVNDTSYKLENILRSYNHPDKREWTHGTFADLDADGLVDHVQGYTNASGNKFQRTWRGRSEAPDLLLSVNDSLGKVISVDYAPMTDTAIYEKGDIDAPAKIDIVAPMYLVDTVSQDDGLGGTARTFYSYGGARGHQNGRGFLGFEWVEVDNEQTDIITRTEYRQVFPYVGQVKSSETFFEDGGGKTLISSQENTWAETQLHGGKSRFVYTSNAIAKTYEVNDGPGNDYVTQVETATIYDTYGQATQVTVTTEDNNGANTEEFKTKTINTYYPVDENDWHLGRLTTSEVRKSIPSDSGAFVVRESEFDYTNNGFLKRETIEPNDPNLKLETTYTYDTFGNVLTTTVDGPDISPRTTTVTYDADGQFAVSETNPLGHSETRAYDERYGLLTSLTGPNSLTTTWQYDGFGRKTREDRADGTYTTWEYKFCTGGISACPAEAIHTVQERHEHAGSRYTSWTRSYFDVLNRVIRTDTEGFDNSLVFVDTEFDNQGRVIKTSRPYYDSANPSIYWNTTEYDSIGRILKTIAADGSFNEVTYDGLVTSTTSKQPNGTVLQVDTRTENAIGQLKEVEDNDNNTVEYSYDLYGNLVETKDPLNETVIVSYDLRGRKTAIDDPNMGSWTYEYNAVGELVSQTDALGQRTDMTYDKLGRMLTRIDLAGTPSAATSTWDYDTATKGVGKLRRADGPNGNYQILSYDSLGRLSQTTTNIDGTSYDEDLAYDFASRVNQITYPSGFSVTNNYNGNGFLTDVVGSNGTTYWEADIVDSEGRILEETLGNGLRTLRDYDNQTGRIGSIQTLDTGIASVQDLAYEFDFLGNLVKRRDLNLDRKEQFLYDGLNRLTENKLKVNSTGSTLETTTYSYDAVGNILSKSDVGAYLYGAGNAGPNAVTTAGNNTYTYDNNGSMVAGAGRAITWSSYNKPTIITDTTTNDSVSFVYGHDRARLKQVITQGTSLTTIRYIGGRFERHDLPGGNVEERHYIAAGATVAMHVITDDGASTSTKDSYFHKDHLGSIDTVTDSAGAVQERLSYDAHGKRRETDWDAAATPIYASETLRGFTGHEHLDTVGLIHMNGRVYDPTIGRFLSADPFVQLPESTQGFNRYTYVNNNPLSYTDPSGFFLSSLFKAFKKLLSNPIIQIAVAAVVAYFTFGAGSFFAGTILGLEGIAAGAVAGAVSGFSAGFVSSGFDLRAAAFGAATGAIFGAIGASSFFDGFDAAIKNFGVTVEGFSATRVVAHGLVGGTRSELQGGKFLSGFVAGAAGKAATPFINTAANTDTVGGMAFGAAAAATVGGTASVIGGGKFANGAQTAGFGYLFNNGLSKRLNTSAGKPQSEPKNHSLTVVAHLDDESDKIGHAFVILEDSDSNVLARGYWPEGGFATYGEAISGEIDGIVLDEMHTGYYEYYINGTNLNASKTFLITESEYKAAINHIDAVSQSPGKYSLFGNMCGSFASDVASAAGQSTGVIFSSPQNLYDEFGG
ncbi:MAG: RHS repeat-associated core domain-containing protein, partial [Pseudomonadota bacterium]